MYISKGSNQNRRWGWKSRWGQNRGFVKKTMIKPKDTSNGILGEKKGKIQKCGNKFGFIQCGEYEEPVFVLRDELRAYKPGQIVKFTAFMDEQGKVSAKDLKSGLDNAGASKWRQSKWKPNNWKPGKWLRGGGRRTIPKNTSNGILGEKMGKIERRGRKFGFITCDEFEEPVFVLGDELKQWKPGQTIKFTAFTDEQGKVQAKDLRSGLKEGRKWGPQDKDASAGILGEKLGKIDKRGRKFGFIKCDEYQEPVFVLADELKRYQQGMMVKFTAFIDNQGKVQAKDLKSGLK